MFVINQGGDEIRSRVRAFDESLWANRRESSLYSYPEILRNLCSLLACHDKCLSIVDAYAYDGDKAWRLRKRALVKHTELVYDFENDRKCLQQYLT